MAEFGGSVLDTTLTDIPGEPFSEEELLRRECERYGLPVSLHALLRHIRNNAAAILGAKDSTIEILEKRSLKTPQEVHLVALALRASHETCRTYPGGPSPRSRTAEFDALAERFEAIDEKEPWE